MVERRCHSQEWEIWVVRGQGGKGHHCAPELAVQQSGAWTYMAIQIIEMKGNYDSDFSFTMALFPELPSHERPLATELHGAEQNVYFHHYWRLCCRVLICRVQCKEAFARWGEPLLFTFLLGSMFEQCLP